jgi:hypothetical protein
MKRNPLTLAVLAPMALGIAFAAGCASTDKTEKPYALTGSSGTSGGEMTYAEHVEHNRLAAKGNHPYRQPAADAGNGR